ncbi:hypothetical protein F5B21DRAFT_504079 [Xylaria acuta]|nr:hypothetical protein F5B21DRAFT_504079 [Xylaria acuta]
MRVALLLLTAAFAVAMPITTIVIETLHEGAETGLTNLTITIPVGPPYRNAAVFRAVSALYILENDATSCIPYSSELATGPHGHPFTFGHPARFSKNKGVVGSFVCTRN